MRDNLASPFICATKTCSCTEWFVCLKEMMKHAYLHADEKYLWLWLATQCTNNLPLTCSFSYEQISQAVNISSQRVHRILFRLRIMGFLMAPIPIWYGELTAAMQSKVYRFYLLLPPRPFLDKQHENALIFPQSTNSDRKVVQLSVTAEHFKNVSQLKKEPLWPSVMRTTILMTVLLTKFIFKLISAYYVFAAYVIFLVIRQVFLRRES